MADKSRTSISSCEIAEDMHHLDGNIFSSDLNTSSSIMNTSQLSAASSMGCGGVIGGTDVGSTRGGAISHESVIGLSGSTKTNINITHNLGVGYCRFPKLEECAHFHYERVQLGRIQFHLMEDKSDQQSSSVGGSSSCVNNTSQLDVSSSNITTTTITPSPNLWFIIKVSTENSDPFLIRRSFENLKMLDEMLHRCVFDRKISGLENFDELDYNFGTSTAIRDSTDTTPQHLQLETLVSSYLMRFSQIVSDALTCGPILTWFQLDNKGRRLPLADMDTMKSINTPAVGAAYGIRKYMAQACDEISIEVGDMISVIDMPSPAESTWWRGKKSHIQKSQYEVGFFPQSCVATIGDKVPRHLILPAPLVGSLAVSPTKPVLRKHGKLIAFFRSFILSRPSRRRLKQSGIYKERVFSCDLSEHLLNSGQDIPMVLKCCAEFIEEFGIVDGIYRLSGITSNIQKLRRSFDEERIPDFSNPEIRQDIHALSSLLKMYFRELPNPLCTYQLYNNFVDAIQSDLEHRLRQMQETVQKLPPPHYRTLKYLTTHLNKISTFSTSTGMTDRNLAIVWAPNLLRSPALESGGVAALRGVGVQAVVTEYLITNCVQIFDGHDDFGDDRYESLQYDSLTDTESIQQQLHLPHLHPHHHHHHGTHSHPHSIQQQSMYLERPKSLSVGGPKLISLEEAQKTRHNRLEFIDVSKSHPVNTPGGGCSSYIEVGGGPSSLPDKYHTVLPVPRSWQKRKTHSWKSLFSRNTRNSSSNQDIKNFNVITAKKSNTKQLSRPNRDERRRNRKTTKGVGDDNNVDGDDVDDEDDDDEDDDDDDDVMVKHISLRNSGGVIGGDNIAKSNDIFNGKNMEICVRSSSIDSLRTVGHSRSVSHDSYFDLLQSPIRAGAVPGVGGGVVGVGVAACPSREFSELGINFDREEPEMRIFSESESLVNSPRVSKETSRRNVRNHGAEHVTSTSTLYPNYLTKVNSNTSSGNINPSPKKQPRLNEPNSASWSSSSSSSSPPQQQQQQSPSTIASSATNQKKNSASNDESTCKRYKLEDQLSDIQYIDCSTPEHSINNPNTIYTTIQVHNPPASRRNSELLNEQHHHNRDSSSSMSSTVFDQQQQATVVAASATSATGISVPAATVTIRQSASISSSSGSISIGGRYSYPGGGGTNKINSDDKDSMTSSTKSMNNNNKKSNNKDDRFSYPGIGEKFTEDKKYISSIPINNEASSIGGGGGCGDDDMVELRQKTLKKPIISVGRFSYSGSSASPSSLIIPMSGGGSGGGCVGSSGVGGGSATELLRKSFNDVNSSNVDIRKSDLEQSKLSLATPTTPFRSPRYSLLVGGDTSSENSSSLNTPVFDMESSGLLLMPNTADGGGCEVFDGNNKGNSLFSLPGHHHLPSDDSESSILSPKREHLSLDLATSNMSVDGDVSHSSSTTNQYQYLNNQHRNNSSSSRHTINIPSTPNTPNYTQTSGNTSQSMTPSEFGYQHLNRQSSSVVSLENSPKSSDRNIYENLEHSFSNYEGIDRLGKPMYVAAISPTTTTHRKDSTTTITPAATTTMSTPPNTSSNNTKLTSPIRSTINITYNLKSPIKLMGGRNDFSSNYENQFIYSKIDDISPTTPTPSSNLIGSDYEFVNVSSGVLSQQSSKQLQEKSLLETNFDENMVYEQVKMFKGAISEVNSMLEHQQQQQHQQHRRQNHQKQSNNGNDDKHQNINSDDGQICLDSLAFQVNTIGSSTSAANDSGSLSDEDERRLGGEINSNIVIDDISVVRKKFSVQSDDISMDDQEIDIQDSLEHDKIHEYENYEFPRCEMVYENVELRQSGGGIVSEANTIATGGVSIGLKEPNRSSSNNFIVRQLANKFETSPDESSIHHQPFDFNSKTSGGGGGSVSGNGGNSSSSVVLINATNRKLDNNQNAAATASILAQSLATEQSKDNKNTRSLDENAFIREFGTVPTISDNTNNEIPLESPPPPPSSSSASSSPNNRRMSLEFTKPKTLNPPKRLPDLRDDKDQEICKESKLKLNLKSDYDLICLSTSPTKQQPASLSATKYIPVKITPTTENPISLIQQNVVSCSTDAITQQQQQPLSLNDESSNNSSLSSITTSSASTINSNATAAAATGTGVGGVKLLNNCKLDRERIERIKEERRHQLNEKFRSESFKSLSSSVASTPGSGGVGGGCVDSSTDILDSIVGRSTLNKSTNDYSAKAKSKSKIELRDLKDSTMSDCYQSHKNDFLRYKSKSRSDIRNNRDEILFDHHHQHSPAILQQHPTSGGRVRRISDEKNQNLDYLIDGSSGGVGIDKTNTVLSSSPPTGGVDDKISTATSMLFRRENSLNSAVVSGGGGNKTKIVATTGSAMTTAPAPVTTTTTTTTNNVTTKSRKFDKDIEYIASNRDRDSFSVSSTTSAASTNRASMNSLRERISPQFSIRDVAAMFESRSQNQ